MDRIETDEMTKELVNWKRYLKELPRQSCIKKIWEVKTTHAYVYTHTHAPTQSSKII